MRFFIIEIPLSKSLFRLMQRIMIDSLSAPGSCEKSLICKLILEVCPATSVWQTPMTGKLLLCISYSTALGTDHCP